MVSVDVSHSSLYPYGVAVAKEHGASRIYLEAHLPNIHPDVLGIREGANVKEWSTSYFDVFEPVDAAEKPLIIVQIEVSTGQKLGGKKGKETLEKHTVSATYADFFYILGGRIDGPAIRRGIVETVPGARIYSSKECIEKYGKLKLDPLPVEARK